MSESASDSLAAMRKLRVAELREQLSVMGLPTTGLKSDLVDRLFAALHPEQAAVDTRDDPGSATDEPPSELGEYPGRESTSPARVPSQKPAPAAAAKEPTAKDSPPPLSAKDFQELKRKRAEKFGVSLPASDGQRSKLDEPLGSGKRGRRERDGGVTSVKLNLENPDVQKRLCRFGLQMHDPDSLVAKSVAAEEAKLKKEERLKRFGVVHDDHAAARKVAGASTTDFQAAVAARKARFGAA